MQHYHFLNCLLADPSPAVACSEMSFSQNASSSVDHTCAGKKSCLDSKPQSLVLLNLCYQRLVRAPRQVLPLPFCWFAVFIPLWDRGRSLIVLETDTAARKSSVCTGMRSLRCTIAKPCYGNYSYKPSAQWMKS